MIIHNFLFRVKYFLNILKYSISQLYASENRHREEISVSGACRETSSPPKGALVLPYLTILACFIQRCSAALLWKR